MTHSAWTADLVEERLRAAASTLRRSRAVGVGPSAIRSAWPSIAPTKEDQRLAYGYNAARAPRIEPSSAELTAMDAVLGWIADYLSRDACERARLPADAGWVAWARAQGHSYPRISEMRGQTWGKKAPGGNSREACRQIAAAACQHVADCLRRAGVSLQVGAAPDIGDPSPVASGRREVLPRQMDARRFVTNRRPCGECRHMQTRKDHTTSCRLRGGAVAPSQRAQHPEGEPCWEAKPAS